MSLIDPSQNNVEADMAGESLMETTNANGAGNAVESGAAARVTGAEGDDIKSAGTEGGCGKMTSSKMYDSAVTRGCRATHELSAVTFNQGAPNNGNIGFAGNGTNSDADGTSSLVRSALSMV